MGTDPPKPPAPPAPTLAQGAGAALSQMQAQAEVAKEKQIALRDAIIKLHDDVQKGKKPDVRGTLWPLCEEAFKAGRVDPTKILSQVMGPIMTEISGNDARHQHLVGVLTNLGIAVDKIATKMGVDLSK